MSENKKIKNATSTEYKGIKLKSKLEYSAFKLFDEAGLDPRYEESKLVLIDGFKPTIPFYTRNKKTKLLESNMKKIISMTYTPDFTIEYNGYMFYVEIKGFQNDSYPLKKKLFRKFLETIYSDTPNNAVYFELFSVGDIKSAIEIIKNYGTN